MLGKRGFAFAAALYVLLLRQFLMYRFIFEFAADRLVFFISHRIGFAEMADRIVVVDSVKIVEDGTYYELIVKSDGLYAGMFEAQKE